ncbi:hypothetical protein FCULG_00011472 [Fusarium culmorum]|uniref:Uncharacterized protein n=1 Tax=Fusarium culmorum TaxID=5516 RepID=A0A2T4H576_FUSCU|nr:hypothetical protein FCULG_00011472 [Fusarium culmorum]
MDDGQYYVGISKPASCLRPGPDEKTRVWNDPSSQHDTILDSTELDGCNWTSDVDCANRREPVVGSAIVTSLQLAALGYYHAATGASPAGLGARKMGPLERQGGWLG